MTTAPPREVGRRARFQSVRLCEVSVCALRRQPGSGPQSTETPPAFCTCVSALCVCACKKHNSILHARHMHISSLYTSERVVFLLFVIVSTPLCVIQGQVSLELILMLAIGHAVFWFVNQQDRSVAWYDVIDQQQRWLLDQIIKADLFWLRVDVAARRQRGQPSIAIKIRDELILILLEGPCISPTNRRIAWVRLRTTALLVRKIEGQRR